MSRIGERFMGTLLFNTRKGTATVAVYRGDGTFILRRTMPSGRVDERIKVDAYHDDLNYYIGEAALEWADLDREDVEVKPVVRDV